MNYIIYYLATLIPLGLLDMVWIAGIAKKFYADELGFLFSKTVKVIPVIFFYPIYAFAVLLLAVMPAVSSGSWVSALWRGALLGLAAYGAYDLTNHATIAHWPALVNFRRYRVGNRRHCSHKCGRLFYYYNFKII